ncbi:hypothetical protein KKJ01_18155, partial [Xenorhabdus bovienii]
MILIVNHTGVVKNTQQNISISPQSAFTFFSQKLIRKGVKIFSLQKIVNNQPAYKEKSICRKGTVNGSVALRS